MKDRSRAPTKQGNQLPTGVKEAIIQTHLELEANADLGEGLKYIGGQAIRTRLKPQKVTPLPSVSTIERVIRAAGMTKPKSKSVEPEINYPRLRPTPPAGTKRPLREGRLHVIRRVSPEGTVRVLNVDWIVPQFDPTQGVWVTVEFKEEGATFSIFDEAPDTQHRQCLAIYPFPLSEPVLPRETEDNSCDETIESLSISEPALTLLPKPLPPEPMFPLQQMTTIGEWLVLSSISRTVRLARHVIFTMY